MLQRLLAGATVMLLATGNVLAGEENNNQAPKVAFDVQSVLSTLPPATQGLNPGYTQIMMPNVSLNYGKGYWGLKSNGTKTYVSVQSKF